MTVDPYFWLAAAPVVGLATDCAAHILLVRVTGGDSGKRYWCILAAFALGVIVSSLASMAALSALQATFGDSIALLLMNSTAYVGLGYGYFGFVNLNLTSLRIRILQELLALGGRIPKSTLQAKYNTEQVIRVRIDRLVDGGHLVERQGRFQSGKPTLLCIASAVGFMRRVVFGRRARQK